MLDLFSKTDKMDYKKIVIQWKEFEMPELKPRNYEINLEIDFIHTITGPRRAGKTYFCFQTIKKLIREKTPKENILYINFEDPNLIGANNNDLDLIMERFQETYSPSKDHNIYLFFDEIQNVKNWDAWIRKTHDSNKKIKIILTGSSSKMLSKEISTNLRGRVLNTEIYPLSFKELLIWKDTKYDLKTISHSKDKTTVKRHFDLYLKNGGYPAVIGNERQINEILKSYYESTILKDIIERNNIKESKKLRVLANLLFEATTKEISYTKLANRLKSLGFDISKNTIIEFISHFEDAYLFFQNIKYEYSITKQLGSIKKIYCIDNGILNAVSFKFSEDIGKLLENLVFIELKRRNITIFYNRDKYECDFLVHKKNKITETIQVTHELNEDNEKREINGLIEAMNEHNLKEGLILTYDQEKKIISDDKKISVIPAYKWLLAQLK